MIVYIAGPMTGLVDFNYRAFFEAERSLTERGHTVLNPARTEDRENCITWTDYMRASLRDLSHAEGIALLDGWQNSRGAQMEYRIGHDLGIEVAPLTEWLMIGCDLCEHTGWLHDPTACGDPDHCSPVYPCTCNPEGLDE